MTRDNGWLKQFLIECWSNSQQLWFCIYCVLGLVPIRSKTKTNHDFPRFMSSCLMSYLWVFIGSLDCLCPLLLARVITTGLVFQHSVKNCSIKCILNDIFKSVILNFLSLLSQYRPTGLTLRDYTKIVFKLLKYKSNFANLTYSLDQEYLVDLQTYKHRGP